MLRCLCCAKAYTNITAKATFNPIFLLFSKVSKFTAEEQSEECAFSGHIDFSRNGRGKNREICYNKAVLERKNHNTLSVVLTATTATNCNNGRFDGTNS